MAKRKKGRSRTRKSVSVRRAPVRRTKSRRKKGLSASGTEIMTAAKANGSGFLGGAGYTLPMVFMKPNTLTRGIIGVAGAMILSFMNMPFVAAGVSGALGADMTKAALSSSGLADDYDLQDVDYVDEDTLSDSGYVDENGNAVVMDDDGIMYALNDGGDYEAIGDAYSLQEDAQDVMMLPLYN
jgi:hypothetical protein